MAIDEREGANEFIPGDGFVVGVGHGKMSAGDETGSERDQKEAAREKEGSYGRTARSAQRDVLKTGVRRPSRWRGRRGGDVIWEKVRHFMRIGPKNEQ